MGRVFLFIDMFRAYAHCFLRQEMEHPTEELYTRAIKGR